MTIRWLISFIREPDRVLLTSSRTLNLLTSRLSLSNLRTLKASTKEITNMGKFLLKDSLSILKCRKDKQLSSQRRSLGTFPKVSRRIRRELQEQR